MTFPDLNSINDTLQIYGIHPLLRIGSKIVKHEFKR